jgi:DNA-binding NarL/FixJ family response regulator
MNDTAEVKVLRVVLADDHDLVRSGIRSLIEEGMTDVDIVAEARNGVELLRAVEALHPDLVLTDISMPTMDGFAAMAELRERHPDVKVLVLSMYDTVDFVRRAVASGACGYLMKDAPPRELLQALRSVATTGSYFSAQVARRLLEQPEPGDSDVLTERQVQILKLIAQGLAAKQIAFELKLSPKTVDVHRARIMERLGVNDIASLTRYAVRKGLVQP